MGTGGRGGNETHLSLIKLSEHARAGERVILKRQSSCYLIRRSDPDRVASRSPPEIAHIGLHSSGTCAIAPGV